MQANSNSRQLYQNYMNNYQYSVENAILEESERKERQDSSSLKRVSADRSEKARLSNSSKKKKPLSR